VVTTIIAGIARPLGDFMMFGNFFTSRTFNAIRIKPIFQPLKTGFTVGKFMLKIFDSIVNHIQSNFPSIRILYKRKILAVKDYHIRHFYTNKAAFILCHSSCQIIALTY
jgi:hypothetical protein